MFFPWKFSTAIGMKLVEMSCAYPTLAQHSKTSTAFEASKTLKSLRPLSLGGMLDLDQVVK